MPGSSPNSNAPRRASAHTYFRARLAAGLFLLCAVLAWAAGRGFATQHLLEEHFSKHGHEFGSITRDQYLHMAQQLRDSRPGKNILEAKRSDGGGAKFDKRYGWFVAYDADGTLRTFFIPNEGIRYFERQGRNHDLPDR